MNQKAIANYDEESLTERQKGRLEGLREASALCVTSGGQSGVGSLHYAHLKNAIDALIMQTIDSSTTEKNLETIGLQPIGLDFGTTQKSADCIRALIEAHDLAMDMCARARIPECGDFAAIAQNLAYIVQELPTQKAPAAQAPKPPKWYSRNEIVDVLKNMNYCESIAQELADWFVIHLQHSFNKGFQVGQWKMHIVQTTLSQTPEVQALFEALNGLYAMPEYDGTEHIAIKRNVIRQKYIDALKKFESFLV